MHEGVSAVAVQKNLEARFFNKIRKSGHVFLLRELMKYLEALRIKQQKAK